MELSNEFDVEVPVDEAWAVLTDLERIAPCLPGAQLTEVEGDEHRGTVKVKVGPITAQYEGVARFVERDDTAHRAVIDARGRDTRGQGNANATITATLAPVAAGTRVSVHTDLKLTGKVAQFGRGAIQDVSTTLLEQFVTCLETDLLASPEEVPAPGEPFEAPDAGTDSPGSAPAASPARSGPDGEVRRVDGPEAEAIDLLAVVGGRYAVAVGIALVALVALVVIALVLS